MASPPNDQGNQHRHLKAQADRLDPTRNVDTCERQRDQPDRAEGEEDSNQRNKRFLRVFAHFGFSTRLCFTSCTLAC